MKVPRGTETDEAPAWQGATSENIGNICGRSNAARPGAPGAHACALGWRRDASSVECSGTFTTGSYTSGDRVGRTLEGGASKAATDGRLEGAARRSRV